MFLAAATVLACTFITNVVFATWLALVTAVLAVALFAWLSYALPLLGRSPARSGSVGPKDEPPTGLTPFALQLT